MLTLFEPVSKITAISYPYIILYAVFILCLLSFLLGYPRAFQTTIFQCVYHSFLFFISTGFSPVFLLSSIDSPIPSTSLFSSFYTNKSVYVPSPFAFFIPSYPYNTSALFPILYLYIGLLCFYSLLLH